MATAQTPSAPTLTDAAFFARLFIKYGAFFLAFLIVGRVVLNISASVWTVLNPPKPPGPTNGFGTLPALIFPASDYQITSYSLQTKNNGFPVLENQLPVYFMPISKATLFSLDQSKQVASSLGYVFAPEQLGATQYQWKRTTPLTSTLIMDIVNRNFTLTVDWASDPNFLTTKNVPAAPNAQSEAKNILRTANLLTPDVATAEARPTYLKAAGTEFTPAISQSEADFIQIDQFRLPIQGKFPILRFDPTYGAARIVFSGNPARDKKIVSMNYLHFPVEYEQFETYRLITPAEAWAQLQAGKGFVALADEGTTDAIVRNVGLAYYDSETPQNYLQPMYVFSGDNNFYAYVPAVAPLAVTTNR